MENKLKLNKQVVSPESVKVFQQYTLSTRLNLCENVIK